MKILLISNFVPKPGFNYPGFDCAVEHRLASHKRIFSMQRWFSETIDWEVLLIEKTDESVLSEKLVSGDFDKIILSGSPYNISENQAWVEMLKSVLSDYFKKNDHKPVFGICFGLQLLVEIFGGEVSSMTNFQEGDSVMNLMPDKRQIPTYTFHGDAITRIPTSARILATGPNNIAYLVWFSNKIYGVQSHPEKKLNSKSDNLLADRFWRNFFKVF